MIFASLPLAVFITAGKVGSSACMLSVWHQPPRCFLRFFFVHAFIEWILVVVELCGSCVSSVRPLPTFACVASPYCSALFLLLCFYTVALSGGLGIISDYWWLHRMLIRYLFSFWNQSLLLKWCWMSLRCSLSFRGKILKSCIGPICLCVRFSCMSKSVGAVCEA